MSKSFKQLKNVLTLEAQQDYQNKSVVGGMRQLITFWVTQAREEAVDEMDRIFVEQVAETLVEYDRLPNKQKKAEIVKTLQEKLKSRKERLAKSSSASRSQTTEEEKPSSTPSPPPSSPPPPKQNRPIAQVKKKHRPKKPKQATTFKLRVVPSEPDSRVLSQSIDTLSGVGPKLSEKLNRLGIETIQDLFYTLPRRYDDFTLMKPINRLQYGEQVTVIGTIWEVRAQRTRSGEMVQCTLSDGTGQVKLSWFNQPWLMEKLSAGMQIVVSGKVQQYLGRPIFNAPQWEPVEWEPLKTRRILPIYPLTEGLKMHKVREIMQQAIEQLSAKVPDPLPHPIRQRNQFLSLPIALQNVHFPQDQEILHQAHRRLIFDELFLLQMGMLSKRQEWQQNAGLPLVINQTIIERFLLTLPFALTDAQNRVVREILADMAQETPMNRLLQGDVGAGKTVVAAAAMFAAVQDKTQAAMMAPTEILAEQHYQGLQKLFANEDLTIRLLIGSTPESERQEIMSDLDAGNIDILIGTHALIQPRVAFHKLSLVIIDEQHRFGVDQRQALRDKGPQSEQGTQQTPHLLVMSATPIPRTLAHSLYGDLDLSIIDELPPGRQEIKTRWLRPSERERAYAFVRGQIEKGHQAFIICPLVEESDKIEATAAVEEHARLQNEIFPDLKLGLLHGRMNGNEKEEVMHHFYNNEYQILISTSVIEVGIDVPNSTVMVIEGANRFGLAQLHQFRGRVGRGQHQSYCLLISDNVSPESEQRLQAMEQTNDGFVLAEKDLELRGPGQFFGRQQSGLPEIQMAALLNTEALMLAREEAQALFEIDPLLTKPEHEALREKVNQFWQNVGDVS